MPKFSLTAKNSSGHQTLYIDLDHEDLDDAVALTLVGEYKGGRVLHAWERNLNGHRQTFEAICNPDLNYKLDKGKGDTKKCQKCVDKL